MRYKIGSIKLDSELLLDNISLEYDIYGKINSQKSNVILLFHILTSSHIAYSNDKKGSLEAGWWSDFIGKGKSIDTSKYAVICINYLGGCHGSSGPIKNNDVRIETSGKNFPSITIQDIVKTQIMLLDLLGIYKLHAVIGCSIGGIMALEIANTIPNRINKVISFASGMRVSPMQVALNFEQIFSIEAFDMLDKETTIGLELARLIALKSYISMENINNYSSKEDYRFSDYQPKSNIENFLYSNVRLFTKRFNKYSYLLLLKAWNNYVFLDKNTVKMASQKWLIISINSDECFLQKEQITLKNFLMSKGIKCEHYTSKSQIGHDSFIKEHLLYNKVIKNFLSID
jgi:homoserine O-acetyltransferase